EFITWWAFGFLLQQLVTVAIAAARRQPLPKLSFRRGALVLAGSFVALSAMLWAARWYQTRAIEPVMQQYVGAQVDPFTRDGGPKRPVPGAGRSPDGDVERGAVPGGVEAEVPVPAVAHRFRARRRAQAWIAADADADFSAGVRYVSGSHCRRRPER